MKSIVNCASHCHHGSPPSRGAWIEILVGRPPNNTLLSPPSRGAWIEILPRASAQAFGRGRPPRGGRGLKLPTMAVVS